MSDLPEHLFTPTTASSDDRHETCRLVGMVHLLPLPGSPGWAGSISAILDAAQRDAEALVAGGCDALIVENMGDLPYLNGEIYPETVAAMTRATALVTAFGLPTGVQALAGANREALGIALASSAGFIRAEAFAYGHVADEGWMDAGAGELLRHRANLSAPIHIWADIQKKHAAHALTSDLSLEELCHGAQFCGADALIITGSRTGQEPALDHVKRARSAGLPVLIGSGVTAENAAQYASAADAVIVGSALKVDGDWRNRVDQARVASLRTALDTVRG